MPYPRRGAQGRYDLPTSMHPNPGIATVFSLLGVGRRDNVSHSVFHKAGLSGTPIRCARSQVKGSANQIFQLSLGRAKRIRPSLFSRSAFRDRSIPPR
jgi:hypothetical protein